MRRGERGNGRELTLSVKGTSRRAEEGWRRRNRRRTSAAAGGEFLRRASSPGILGSNWRRRLMKTSMAQRLDTSEWPRGGSGHGGARRRRVGVLGLCWNSREREREGEPGEGKKDLGPSRLPRGGLGGQGEAGGGRGRRACSPRRRAACLASGRRRPCPWWAGPASGQAGPGKWAGGFPLF